MHAVPARRARRAHPAVRGRRRRRRRGRARRRDRGGRWHRGARLEVTRLFVPRGFRSRVRHDDGVGAEARSPRRRLRRGLRRSSPRGGTRRRGGSLLFSVRVVRHASRRGSRRLLRRGRGRLGRSAIRCRRGAATPRASDDLRREDAAAGRACVVPTGGRFGGCAFVDTRGQRVRGVEGGRRIRSGVADAVADAFGGPGDAPLSVFAAFSRVSRC